MTKSQDIFDLPPPADTDMERGLLAAILVDPSVMDTVIFQIAAADFYDPANGQMFAALSALHDARELRSDVRVLLPKLRALHVADAQWPAAAIARLMGQGMASNAPIYAAELRKLSTLRRQRDVACGLLSRVHRPGADPEQLARWTEAAISLCDDDRQPQSRLIGEIASDVLESIEDATQQGRGVMTGLSSVDEVTGGMMAGELIIIAARPGNGKTSLATQIALHSAKRGREVLFISLEMAQRELTQRVMCSISEVDSRRLRNGSLESPERCRLIDAASGLRELPLHICDPSAATIADVRSIARLHSQMRGLSLIVLDYIGLVKPTDSRRQRYEQVGEVTVGCKSLAKELGIPIIALCQLNREADKQAPTLAMLRESGSIEQDADMVWFLHHAEKVGPVECIVAKHRHGETGKILLDWIPHETRFADLEQGSSNRVGAFDDYNRRGAG